MDRQEALDSLDGVSSAMHDQFDGDSDLQPRLDQLDTHMATVRMVVEHLHDEADRAAPGG